VGHLESARAEFDRAVDILLESPYGARTDARLREHFDRLVDRINAYEVTALRQGDGFAEKKEEPASIDELLTIATFRNRKRRRKRPRPSRKISPRPNTTSPFRRTRGCSYVELFQGRLRTSSRRPDPRDPISADDSGRLPGRRASAGLAYIPIIESGFAERGLEGQREGTVAVHESHGTRERPAPRPVYRRAVGSREGTLAAASYLKTLNKLFDGD
jgi:membrane-bound lytic murein transglycosylase D